MKSLIIKDIFAQTLNGKQILKGVSLNIKSGETHVIMGPNGGGKSTLALVLMGHPGYKITEGKIIVDGTDVTNLSPDKRARLGLFLAFQYPIEVPGVNFANFLRMAVNENKKGEEKISPLGFRNIIAKQAKKLSFSDEITKRMLNEGFSGGEKKKAEVLQMTVLKPKYAILDEPDSGLDVDALKIIAKTISNLDFPLGLILITHYQRVLHYLQPDFVHILLNGKIVKSGKASLAKQVEKTGYESFKK